MKKFDLYSIVFGFVLLICARSSLGLDKNDIVRLERKILSRMEDNRNEIVSRMEAHVEVMKRIHDQSIEKVTDEMRSELFEIKQLNLHIKSENGNLKKSLREIDAKQENIKDEIIRDLKNAIENTEKSVSKKLMFETDIFREDLFAIIDINGEIRSVTNGVKKEIEEVKEFLFNMGNYSVPKNCYDLKLKDDNISSIPQIPAKDCYDLQMKGVNNSGIHLIYPFDDPSKSVQVVCDQSSHGGGWTVIQHLDAKRSYDVFISWNEYAVGWGIDRFNISTDFFLGFETIYALTKCTNTTQLRIEEMREREGENEVFVYDAFSIKGEDEMFRANFKGGPKDIHRMHWSPEWFSTLSTSTMMIRRQL